MSLLVEILKYELIILLLSLILISFYKLYRQGYSYKSLIYNRQTKKLDKARLQKVIMTLVIAAYIILMVYGNPEEFPVVPEVLLLLMGGSSFTYLGFKAQDMLKMFSKK